MKRPWLFGIVIGFTLLTMIALVSKSWWAEPRPTTSNSRISRGRESRVTRQEGGLSEEQQAIKAERFQFSTKVEQERLLRRLTESIERLPKSSQVLHLAAITNAEILQTERAVELFRSALAASPREPSISKDYADVLLQIGKPQEAVDTLESVMEPSLEISMALGEAMAQAGELEEAIQILESLLLEHSQNADLRLQLARLQNQVSQFEAAEANARFALAKRPQEREASIALATALIRQGKREAAREVQRSMPRIVREQPTDDAGYQESFRDFASHTYSALAAIYMADKQFSEATSDVDHALLIRPNGEEPLVAKVDLLRRQNKLKSAAGFQRRLATAFPHNALHQTNAASLAVAAGLMSDAVDFMKKAAEIDPSGNSDARYADMLSAIGRHDEAVAAARLAVKRLANRDAYSLLISCLQEAGREAEAISTLLEARQLFPGEL